MKKLMVILSISVFFLQIVSAGYGFDAFVNEQTQSFEIDAEYGSSEPINLKVLSGNYGLIDHFCDLSCSYKINGNFAGNFNTLIDGNDGNIQTYTLALKNKGKDGAKDNFVFDFSCGISTSGFCRGGSLEKSVTLTINYLLNPEQREAKAFIEGVLITLNENIKDADSKIRKVETKLNSFSSNVKVGSLPSDINFIRNTHNSLKGEIENIDKIVKQDFDYILARNIYRISLPTGITSNGNEAENLEKELDKIIEAHNRISGEINSLGEKNSLVNSKLSLLNEINNADEGIILLIENFKSGNFGNYDEIERSINYYNSLLDEILFKATNEIEQLKLTGNSILGNEHKKLCDKYEFCLEGKEFGTIEETCNYLKKLQEDIISENEKRVFETQDENKEVKEKKDRKGFFSRIINFFKSILGLVSGNIIDTTPKERRIIELSEDYKKYISTNCDFKIKNYDFEKLKEVKTEIGELTGQGIKETEEAIGQCCIGGECTLCCIEESCKSNPSLYPIIFVHGHSVTSWNSLDYSIDTFKEFENRLKTEDNYAPIGVLLPDSDISKVKESSWGVIRKPISVRVSYYLGVYDENGRTIGKEQDQSIDVYSQRLRDVVDIVLHHTGKDKVIIVSHSMGGLVSRNYIKNHGGDEKVYKLVTIGTPNHGIYGNVGVLCGTIFTGNLGLQECEDMQYDSSFIAQINSGDETPENTNYLTIAGNCDYNGEDYHDEVVRVGSVKLEGADNVIIEGNCVSGIETFHQELPSNLQVYQETMKFIKNIN